MSNEDNPQSSTKEILDAATGLIKAVPVYEDILQPAAKEIGTALETVAKTVNIALAPISGVIWSYETIKNFVSSEVPKKLQNIAPENIEPPNPMVAGPALEALKYTGHNLRLRNMYANLLANALDKNTKNDAHPSFVEIIKQLSPEEAVLLLSFSQIKGFPKICHYSYRHSAQGGLTGMGKVQITSGQVAHEFNKLCLSLKLDITLNYQSALDNFRRLKILDVETITNHKIDNSFFGRLSEKSGNISGQLELRIIHDEILYFSEFGNKFIEICVVNKT